MPARRLRLVCAAVVILLLVPAPPSVSATAPAPLSTPELIERAVEAGKIDRDLGYLYLAYAFAAPEQLPEAFRSDRPWRGTWWVLQLEDALASMEPGPTRTQMEALLLQPGLGTCFVSVAPMPHTLETEHFYIEYNDLLIRGGLTIEDYAESLETSWETEVDRFRWAAPPVHPTNPPPGGKYHVRIDELSPVLYGFVSNSGTHAGNVGDNPHTPWAEPDAQASCMVLNNDYSLFPGTAQRALDATTAHEFNHSIQYGYGAITGANRPDAVFVEGGATWMEDEVFDESNDNYNYLWPDFDDDMGDHEGSPYSYWITWRGFTERYGTGVSRGGEEIMQAFWEIVSRDEARGLDAMNLALQTRRTTLPDAYHAYAIAVKFNRACGGGYRYPYCFEEGPQYVHGDGVQQGAGPTQPHGSIGAAGGSHSGRVPDNYALNWVVLPNPDGRYRTTLTNTSPGGAFRLSAVCDTGDRFRIRTTEVLIGPGETGEFPVRTEGCQSIVATISNLAQTGANPSSSQERSYTLSTETMGRRAGPGR